MIAVSTRYSLGLSLLLLLPLLLALVHQHLRSPSDDCVNPEAFYDAGRISRTQSYRELPQRPETLRIQWTEGLIELDEPNTDPLRFRIVRSYNPRPLYRAPMKFFPERIDLDREELQQIPSGEIELPVHRVYGHSDTEILLAAYLFVYDSRPVESPYTEQLVNVVSELIAGVRPLTLITVTGNVRGDRFHEVDRAATEWVARAWEHYDAVCSP